MLVRNELVVEDISAGVGHRRKRPMGIDQRRLHKRQSDGFARLPALAGNGDRFARSIIGLVRLDGGKAIKFGARKRGSGSVLTASYKEESV